MSTARAAGVGLGRVGVWTFSLDQLPVAEIRRIAKAVEDLGFGSLWIAEGTASREAFTHASVLLSATTKLVVGTGIANIWARDAIATAAAVRTLADAFPGRFIHGLGVSHSGAVSRRGHEYGQRPMQVMRDYLNAMDNAELSSPTPSCRAPRLLAALRPKMLALAAECADGAHCYFVPVEHTRRARLELGPDPLLVPEQAVVLDHDPATARATARRYTEHYLARENYRNSLLWLGIGSDELGGGGSDDVVDDLVAWGGTTPAVERVNAHLENGADHVVVQVLSNDVEFPLDDLRRLARELL
jgi:probable F420-dependent oxidoreductase